MAFASVFLFLLYFYTFLCQKDTSHTNTRAQQMRGKYAPQQQQKSFNFKTNDICQSRHKLLFNVTPPPLPPLPPDPPTGIIVWASEVFFPRFFPLRPVCRKAAGGGGGGGGGGSVDGGCWGKEGGGFWGKNWWGLHGNPTLSWPWLDYAVANYSRICLKKKQSSRTYWNAEPGIARCTINIRARWGSWRKEAPCRT